MIFDFFESKRNEIAAGQLRRPHGILAKRVGNVMNKTNRFIHDFTIQTLKLEDGERVLEIGFGNGKFFNDVFKVAKKLHVSGLECSSQMVKGAKRKNAETVKSGKLDLVCGDSGKMPFKDNTFDKIYCVNVIYFWDLPSIHLKEVLRVLKPGGKFYAGFRAKEFFSLIPLTEYGFNIYDQQDWRTQLELNGLKFFLSSRIIEPEMLIYGKTYRLYSYCVVGQKPIQNKDGV
ncbi:class I SAM-dependent methyltransferase [Arcticibacterium luteifluviistationis]|nr:class I SAM-dependent methyltransferase [Arcticibacterium luteifluviistationis]